MSFSTISSFFFFLFCFSEPLFAENVSYLVAESIFLCFFLSQIQIQHFNIVESLVIFVIFPKSFLMVVGWGPYGSFLYRATVYYDVAVDLLSLFFTGYILKINPKIGHCWLFCLV